MCGAANNHERPMSGDLTPKQEAFALAYIECGLAAEAYRRAYDVPESSRDQWLYVEASQLLDNPKVALRIKEIQDQAAKLSLYTTKAAFDELEAARALAMAEKNPSAAVSAVTGKVKLFGLDRPRRVEIAGPDGGPVQVENRGAEKLAAFLNGIAERSGTTGETEPE